MLHDYKPGDNITLYGVIESVTDRNSRNNQPFVVITLLYDGKSARCYKWGCTKEQLGVKNKDIVQVNGAVNYYNNSKSLVISEITVLTNPSQELLKKIIPSLSAEDHRLYIEQLTLYISMISDPGYQKLVKIIMKHWWKEFLKSPAAKKNHDAFVGGLLKHTTNVTRIASGFAEIYGNSIDKNLLMAGAILHDLGKIHTYNIDIDGIDISLEGALLDHVFSTLNMFDTVLTPELIKEIGEEKIMLVKHIVVSHHGQRDWGALREPCFPEALLVHLSDMADTHITMFENALCDTEPGHLTDEKIFPYGRKLYRKYE